MFPGTQGGGNWHGVAFNKPLGLIVTNVMTAGQWGHLEAGGRGGRGGRGAPPPDAPAAEPAAAAGRGASAGPPALGKRTPEGGRFWDPERQWSCSEPPWGELVAVNANTGDIAWKVPLGIFQELEARGLKTGTHSLGGSL